MPLRNHPEKGNVGFLCNKCARKPNVKFLEIPIPYFIGLFCQIGVPMANGKNENLWFKVIGRAKNPSEELQGQCFNTPIFVDMAWGDLIEFSRSEILQITDS